MNTEYVINQLEKNIAVFQSLLSVDTKEEYLFKPSPDKWCLLEIVCHLVDEEVDDFKARVKTALDAERDPFYAIDPVDWVTSRKYMEQDFHTKVSQWIDERKASIIYLKSLEQPNWESTFDHVDMGPLSAGHFLDNWLAHDHIHIRQINRTKRAYLAHISNENLAYAGKW